MTKQIKRDIDRLMGLNLRRMREARELSQEQLAEMINSDRRYISAIENGRGMGKNLLDRLCRVFEVDEDSFTRQNVAEKEVIYGKLPQVTRMLMEELESMPEYEQLRLLAELIERRTKGPKEPE